MTQGLAVDEFGRDKLISVCFADLINRKNVRMIQSAGSASFLFEAAQPVGIMGE